MTLRLALVALCCVLCAGRPAAAQPAAPDSASLARTILSDPDLPFVLEKGRALLASGLNAGSSYGEVWIRDLNTFIELALDVQDRAALRQALLVFFHFQGADGNIVDGYIPTEKAAAGYRYIVSPSMPQFRGHKNTVETDQETSLVQAVRRYVDRTGDRGLLDERVNGRTVRERLALALGYVLAHRFDLGYGLVWGATTVDWGDVQPEHPWGVEFDTSSHRAIDVYDNAMFVVAAHDYVHLLGPGHPDAARWTQTAADVTAAVRRHLWDPVLHKYRPHLYLEGSPFPADFDEHRIYYHGGTAVAIEAGFLTRQEIALVLSDMVNNVRFAGAASIGLTVYPPYPAGYFQNKGMGPFSYQNGGDWTWFGGRMIQQLVAHGFAAEAYRELRPMLARVRQNDGFYEWYTVDNRPEGSGTFRGEAGVLGRAIEMLRAWAEAHD